MAIRLLLLESRQELGGKLSSHFEGLGMTVVPVKNLEEALHELKTQAPSLVLVDQVPPFSTPQEVCHEIRKHSDIPLIVTTDRGQVEDKIRALAEGADDYLVKPFDPRELQARIQAVLRRTQLSARQPVLKFEGLEMDRDRRVVMVDATPVPLTVLEFEVLRLFLENPGKVFEREELDRIRGIDSQALSRSTDVLLSRLRQKLGDSAKQPRFFRTVRGIGYLFVANRASS